MRYKKAVCDSLNLAGGQMESIFIHNEDYIIEDVKTKSVFTPKVWSEVFGKPLAKKIKGIWVTPIIEAKIIHTYLGLKLPLKTFAASPKSQTLEFAGLHGYNERSEHLMQHLQELESQLQYTKVNRLDIAMDCERVPKSVIVTLSKNRKPYPHKNTTYYKTPKELEKKKRTNPYMDIKIYDKALYAGLDKPMTRIEFCFI